MPVFEQCIFVFQRKGFWYELLTFCQGKQNSSACPFKNRHRLKPTKSLSLHVKQHSLINLVCMHLNYCNIVATVSYSFWKQVFPLLNYKLLKSVASISVMGLSMFCYEGWKWASWGNLSWFAMWGFCLPRPMKIVRNFIAVSPLYRELKSFWDE